MNELVPFFFINQVIFAFILIFIAIFIFSKYILPRYVRLFLTRFYTYILKSFLEKAYESMEWLISSPPKPHSFTSLPAQSFSLTSFLLSDPEDKDNQGDEQDQQYILYHQDPLDPFDTIEKEDKLAKALTDYLYFKQASIELMRGNDAEIMSTETPDDYDYALAEVKQIVYHADPEQKLEMAKSLVKSKELIDRVWRYMVETHNATESIEAQENSPDNMNVDSSGHIQGQNASSQSDSMNVDSPFNDAGSDSNNERSDIERVESENKAPDTSVTESWLDQTIVGKLRVAIDYVIDIIGD